MMETKTITLTVDEMDRLVHLGKAADASDGEQKSARRSIATGGRSLSAT